MSHQQVPLNPWRLLKGVCSREGDMVKRYPLNWLLAVMFIVPVYFISCTSSGNSDTGESVRFGGMANVEVAETREEETHHITIEGDGYPYTITDYLGYQVTLEQRPERIAVLSGTFLNMWYALGGKSICRTDLRTALLDEAYADEIEALPSVGAVYNANVEAIIEQRPDFIIAQAGVQSNICRTLRDMGFEIVTLYMKTYADVLDHLRVFGVLLGNEDYVEAHIAQMEMRRKAITDRLPEPPKSVVILYVTSSSLAVKLENSIAGDVATILCLENIASGLPPDTLGSETTPLDIEYIVAQNPDVILVTSMISSNEDAKRVMKEEFTTNPAWAGIEAIREGRVVYLPQEYFLYNAAHNYVDAIEYMAKGVYPEIYGPLDE
jgi:iron complex transport system substrate-binding protein